MFEFQITSKKDRARTGIFSTPVFAPAGLFQVSLFQFRHFQQMTQQSNFQRLVSMDGNRDPLYSPCFAIYMMTALNAQKLPAMLLKSFCKLRPRN